MSSLGIFNKETKTYQKVAGTAQAAVLDDQMSDSSTKPVQNKVIKEYVDEKAKENVVLAKTTSNHIVGTVESPLMITNATLNLLHPTLKTTTQNGVTCTANDDGTYTLSGTATADTVFTLCSNATVYASVGTKVKFLGGSTHAPISATIDGITLTEGSTHTLAGGTITASINVTSGAILNNEIVKPMLTPDLEATTDNFVPYNGFLVGSLGKNMSYYPYQLEDPVTENGLTFTVEKEGTIKITGTPVMKYKSTVLDGPNHINMIGKLLKQGYDLKLIYKSSDSNAIIRFQILKKNDNTYIGNFTALKHDAYDWDVYCPIIIAQVDNIVENLNYTISDIMVVTADTTDVDFVPFKMSGNAAIYDSAQFPVSELKAFDDQTNLIFGEGANPRVETYHVKDETGKLILGSLVDLTDNKLNASAVVNNQTTNVSGYALDARQANPNIDGTLAKQVADLNGSLIGMRNGQMQFYNPVLDVNNFFTGISLFNELVSNSPSKEWYLIISAGIDNARVQVAWKLFGGDNYIRNMAAGVWGNWVKK